MGRACSTNGEKRSAYRTLGKLEGKRPLERPTCSWVDNTDMDFGEMELDGVDWTDLAQDRGQ
jgi:hypothetical protein